MTSATIHHHHRQQQLHRRRRQRRRCQICLPIRIMRMSITKSKFHFNRNELKQATTMRPHGGSFSRVRSIKPRKMVRNTRLLPPSRKPQQSRLALNQMQMRIIVTIIITISTLSHISTTINSRKRPISNTSIHHSARVSTSAWIIAFRPTRMAKRASPRRSRFFSSISTCTVTRARKAFSCMEIICRIHLRRSK